MSRDKRISQEEVFRIAHACERKRAVSGYFLDFADKMSRGQGVTAARLPRPEPRTHFFSVARAKLEKLIIFFALLCDCGGANACAFIISSDEQRMKENAGKQNAIKYIKTVLKCSPVSGSGQTRALVAQIHAIHWFGAWNKWRSGAGDCQVVHKNFI